MVFKNQFPKMILSASNVSESKGKMRRNSLQVNFTGTQHSTGGSCKRLDLVLLRINGCLEENDRCREHSVLGHTVPCKEAQRYRVHSSSGFQRCWGTNGTVKKSTKLKYRHKQNEMLCIVKSVPLSFFSKAST